MTSLRRWLAVLTGVAVLLTLPSAVGALPAKKSDLSASDLLGRIQRSGSVGYSGYAESAGGLALPVTNQFSMVADLFGGRRQLRTWWRSDRDWRVDSIGLAGETDVHADPTGFWSWDYESNTATYAGQLASPEIRLPTDTDLLPPNLTRRLLGEARISEATRLPSARVAGISAAGLRIRPSEPESSIDHIDVWADPNSGLPLRVKVFGKQSGSPAMSASFLQVRVSSPPASSTGFAIPAGAELESGTGPDLATALDELGGAVLPSRLAGIELNGQLPNLGSIAVYGRGVTEFAVVPLPRRIGYALRRQIAPAVAAADGSNPNPSDLALSVGPLNLLLTSFNDPGGPWLLVGTVTASTLAAAAKSLPAQSGPR